MKIIVKLFCLFLPPIGWIALYFICASERREKEHKELVAIIRQSHGIETKQTLRDKIDNMSFMETVNLVFKSVAVVAVLFIILLGSVVINYALDPDAVVANEIVHVPTFKPDLKAEREAIIEQNKQYIAVEACRELLDRDFRGRTTGNYTTEEQKDGSIYIFWAFTHSGRTRTVECWLEPDISKMRRYREV